jgi:hypothetical protein
VLTAEQVREALTYDPETGEFRWRVSRGRARSGLIAGYSHTKDDGRKYWVIGIGKRYIKAHRLVWLYTYGKWPAQDVDHIDGNGLNNKLSNLREATRSENCRNRGANCNGTSGYKGVHWHKRTKTWHARIMANGKSFFLGQFVEREKAHEAYVKASHELHGQFGRPT